MALKSGCKTRTLICSRAWPKPPRVQKWTCEGDVPASSEHLESALVAEQARNPDFRGAVLEIDQAAVWKFPSNMPEAEKARLRDRLLGNTIPMDVTLASQKHSEVSHGVDRDV
jgi:hypothetical protein